MDQKAITRDDILRLFGDLTDHAVLEVLETGADFEALEEAAAWIGQENDVMGEARKPLTGAAARVFDIVTREQIFPDDERR